MARQEHLSTLLSQVVYQKHYNGLDGLTPIRQLLDKDEDGSVERFLHAALAGLPEKVRGGIAFALTERYLQTGNLASIQALFAWNDAEIQASVLDGLWDEPSASPEMGPGIVSLAVEGASHPAPEVRTEAACVIQNQSAWRVSVTDALGPLLRLLDDPVPRVRQQAAYAAGNVAKRKYDMAPFLSPLIRNLHHENYTVYSAAAWALWQISKRKQDISAAVTDLMHVLTTTLEYNEPRKNAAGALLHHARKSPANRDAVKRVLASTILDSNRTEIARFLQQFADLG